MLSGVERYLAYSKPEAMAAGASIAAVGDLFGLLLAEDGRQRVLAATKRGLTSRLCRNCG
jgi:hypothetical protein